MTMVTIEEMNSRFQSLLETEGFQTSTIRLAGTEYPGRIAENEYFAVVFQPYSTWISLVDSRHSVELELSNRIDMPSSKTWDAYLLLACQESIAGPNELDQLVRIQYDIKRMRKLVMPGVGDAILKVDELVRPFLSLKTIQRQAIRRDPLGALAASLSTRSIDHDYLSRAIALFKEGRSIDDLQ